MSETSSKSTKKATSKSTAKKLSKMDRAALEYHSKGKPGKVDVQSHKECNTEYALSLAYSPGVAAPCLEIAKDDKKALDYTTKGNLVAVISNGTAVLGLGDIGPLASKPVMEGKGVLFKQFAGIDVFDLELDCDSTEEFINTVQALEPTFGGINLEDIAAPDCFVIEEELKKRLKIPVFHDDQHGTAIITSAALLNACLIAKKKMKNVRVVVNGAGAAAIACSNLMFKLGVQKKNLIMCDSRGAIYEGREEGMNEYKQAFAVKTKARTLADAVDGADVFCGLSVAGVLTPEMLKTMAKNPIVFAMANPNPEIDPQLAHQTRDDVIMATGRSDYPNQVNNVLGFPSIFRGALDVQATQINEEMKVAAVEALAELAQQDVPDSVSAAYNDKSFSFGPEYIIPKPFDPRVLMNVAPAVAKAAMDTGVAQKPIKDLVAYRESLEAMNSFSRGFLREQINQIKTHMRKRRKKPPRIILPDGRSERVLKALNSIIHEGIMEPVLLGYEEVIRARIEEFDLDNLDDVEILHPAGHPAYQEYVEELFQSRQRKGVMRYEAERLMADPYYFAAMAVHKGDADGLVSGAMHNYADCIRPILEIIGTGKENVASGLNIVLVDGKVYFFADTTVNIDPTAEQLATIAIHASSVAKRFGFEPRVGMLSFSNFTAKMDNPKKMKAAADIVRERKPNLIVDGEMQADTALDPAIIDRIFPFCEIKNGANVLVFPNLDAGNIGYKLVQQLGGGDVLGPFLMGVKKPANIVQRTCNVDDLTHSLILTAREVQEFQLAKK